MLKIMDNHLSVAGIRFKLPQNFFIDIEGMEGVYQDGLRLISPEQDCRIAFTTTEVEFDTPVKSLIDIFTDAVLETGIAEDMFNTNETGFVCIEEPQLCEINGLKCAFVKYHTKYNYYYEIHFARIDGADRQLEILLEVSKNQQIDIEDVLCRKSIKEFYKSIELL